MDILRIKPFGLMKCVPAGGQVSSLNTSRVFRSGTRERGGGAFREKFGEVCEGDVAIDLTVHDLTVHETYGISLAVHESK